MNDWQAALEEWKRQQAEYAAQQPQPSAPQQFAYQQPQEQYGQDDPPSDPVAPSAPPVTSGIGPNDQNGNPIVSNYNPGLFGSDDDATRLAQQYGGTVVSAPLREAGGGTAGSPFGVPDARYIQMPNGATVNVGTLLSYEAAHPGDPATATRMIQQEIAKSTPQATGFTGEDAWYQQNIAKDGLPGSGAWQAQGAAMPAADKAMNGVAGAPSVPKTVGAVPPPSSAPPSALPPPASGDNPPSTAPPSNDPPPASGDPSAITRTLPGGYGVGEPGGMSGGAGALGSEWGYKDSNSPGDILANDRKYAYGQGQKLIQNYGEGMAAQDQRGRSLGAVGDGLYAWMAANPGYTPEQASQIMDQQGLDKLNWTPEMANSNFLTPEEQAGIAGDPTAAARTYGANVEGLRQDARNYGGALNGIYDSGATDLNTANGRMSQELDDSIDPAALGLSDDYQQNYNFGQDKQDALVADAARTVGEGTKATTDELQRQANASGTNSPLAMAAALDRERQTGAVASADAMTKARIQAAALGLNTEQTKESTRLGSAQDVSNRRLQAATTTGQTNQANQQFLTAGRANAGLETGKAALDESNTIANQQTQLTGTAEIAAQQRAQAIAQNRQAVNKDNQASQFTRGSYTDQAGSQRGTQVAGAERADLTAARQDTRNEEQTAYNESNSRMAGQLQAFGNTTGAGQSSEANAIRAAQLPTTLDKVIGGAAGAASAFAKGGIIDHPTVGTVGEDGPEIVIKLNQKPMAYRRRNEAAYA